jgi:hypothetical protein
MFDSTSRYQALETAMLTAPDGRAVAYKRRRFLPRGADLPLLAEVTVAQGDRLDVVTARALGDPEQYWRVADANDAMNPDELTADPGRVLRIPLPQV